MAEQATRPTAEAQLFQSMVATLQAVQSRAVAKFGS